MCWPIRNKTSLALFVTLSILSWNSVQAQARPYRDGELLVKFKPGQRADALAELQKRMRLSAHRTLGNSQIEHLTLPAHMTVSQALQIYAQNPAVAYVEPNYYVKAQTLPDDPSFDQLWGLRNTGQMVSGYVGTPGADVDAVRAWEVSTGSDQVIVAVVDTGSDTEHPDLAASIWTNPDEIDGNGIDDDHNGLIDDIHGWDFVDDDNRPQDATGHGTHVAGIIAAQGNNGLGVTGVAWQVRIMPVRFMNAFDSGTISDAIAAIQYALAQGARIINCSWGSSSYSAALEDVMRSADALFICAAGNDAGDNDLNYFYPAGFALPNTLSVAASDQMDRLAWFSNYGSQTVAVAAPGIRILGLQNGRQTLWQDDFEDADISDWTLGGAGDAWHTANPPYVAGTALASSPAGEYTPNGDAWARTPVLNLGSSQATILQFQLIGSSEANGDYLYVEVSTDQINWFSRPLEVGNSISYNGISGSLPYWMPVRADLGPWDGQAQVYVRLRFHTNDSVTGAGFYIDNMTLTSASSGNVYQYLNGTSMAAAFVSGVAALIASQTPAIGVEQLKAVIEASVDLKQDLRDLTLTGGRVNAYNALTLLSDLSLTASPAAADRISLTWTAQAPLNTQMMIQRRSDSQPIFQSVGQADADSGTYTDEHLVPDTTYYYRVQAETQDGRSGYSNQTLATTLDTSTSSDNGSGSGGGGGCFIETIW